MYVGPLPDASECCTRMVSFLNVLHPQLSDLSWEVLKSEPQILPSSNDEKHLQLSPIYRVVEKPKSCDFIMFN